MNEVAVLDGNAQALGVNQENLMEAAGMGSARIIRERFVTAGRAPVAAIICGSGNNGGDGYVVARHLKAHGWTVNVFFVKEPKTPLAISNKQKVEDVSASWALEDAKVAIAAADVVVDALLGSGSQGALAGVYAEAVAAINGAKGHIVSVDIPTGMGQGKAGQAVKPEITVTFHDMKDGMTKELCGEILVVDIGIPPEAQLFTGPGDLQVIPRPSKDTKKGQRGRLLIVGGGPYYGAPVLAALAAQMCGVDLVYLAVPERIANMVASHSTNFILHTYKEEHLTSKSIKGILERFPKATAVVAGPGLGEAAADGVMELLKACTLPMVLDADALAPIGKSPSVLKGKKGVVTPHRGEFRELTGHDVPGTDAEAQAAVMKWAAAAGNGTGSITMLLKSPVDIISDGRSLRLNKTGNPAMAVGGTGDVLTGICGAMLAKGIPPYNAARIGAYLNGRAGDRAFRALGHSLTAHDVLKAIPSVLADEVPWWRN